MFIYPANISCKTNLRTISYVDICSSSFSLSLPVEFATSKRIENARNPQNSKIFEPPKSSYHQLILQNLPPASRSLAAASRSSLRRLSHWLILPALTAEKMCGNCGNPVLGKSGRNPFSCAKFKTRSCNQCRVCRCCWIHGCSSCCMRHFVCCCCYGLVQTWSLRYTRKFIKNVIALWKTLDLGYLSIWGNPLQ